MDFNYTVKKHNRIPGNQEYYCEIRTKVPYANVLITVRSWTDTMDVSLNGKGQFRAGDFKNLDRAVDEAKRLISEAQHGS